jgi:hypothetical protein
MKQLKELPMWQRFALVCLLCLGIAALIGGLITVFK